MAEEIQVVVFRLDKETYAIDISTIKEIIVMREVTGIPCVSELVEGIINLRGHVIPIFNLRKRFSLASEGQTRHSRIIVVEVSGKTVGIIVDSVSEVLRIPMQIIEKPSDLITYNIDRDFIEGIAKLDENLVILLNADKVLAVTGEVPAVG